MNKILAFLFLLSLLIFQCNTNHTNKINQAEATNSLRDGAVLLGTSAFEQLFVANFKPANFPFKADSKYELNDTIPAEKVIQFILEPAEQAGIKAFKDYWGNEGTNALTKKGLEDRFINVDNNVFAVINFGYVNRLNLSEDYYSLVYKCIPTFMEGGYSYTYLCNYSKEGKFMDAVLIGGNAGYVDMQSEWNGSIDEKGRIEVNEKLVKRNDLLDASKDFTENSKKKYQVNKAGIIELTDEKYSGFSGNFLAKESRRLLIINENANGVEVLYHPDANAPQEDMQALQIYSMDKKKNMLSVKFPDSNSPTTIVYDNNRAGFICKNPDGTTHKYYRAE